MKYLLIFIDLKKIKETYNLYNNDLISAETVIEKIFRYTIQEQKNSPEKLIIILKTDDIYDFDFLNYINKNKQISSSTGIKQPEVELVKISRVEKYDWKAFSRVQQILEESGIPKEDLSITIAVTLTYEPFALDITTQLLELEGYTVERLYVDFPKGSTDYSDTSLQQELYKAICTFKDTGTTDRFKKLSEKIKDRSMAELFNQLDEFSQKLNLCQVEELEPIIDKIYDYLDLLELDSDADNNFIGKLCIKLRSLFCHPKPQLSTIVYIRCCLCWKWTSQSLILFTEALPKELVTNRIVECDFSSVSSVTQTPEMELFYTHMIRDMYIPKEKELKDLLISFLKEQLEDESKNLYIEDFTTLFEWFEKGMKEKGITEPFKGVDILYSFPYDHEGRRQLIEFIYHNSPSMTMDKFKKKLSDSIDEIPYFFRDPLMCDKDNAISQKIMGIKYLSLEHIRRHLKGFKLNINYTNYFYFKRFLAYFLYIKIVRNMVCHALSLHTLNDELNEKQKSGLNRFGVDTAIVTIDSLSRNISDAISCLRECLPKNKQRTIKKYYIAIPNPKTKNDINNQLRSLFDNVSPYETVKIFIIKDENTSSNFEKNFIAQIEEFAICNNFFYDIETISDSDEPSVFLSNLIATVEPGDQISADTTHMTNLKMYGMIMFFNTVIEKKAEVKNVICKDYCLTDLINSHFSANDL